ncbi:hypothetical protein [Salibacterium sp. K-3]
MKRPKTVLPAHYYSHYTVECVRKTKITDTFGLKGVQYKILLNISIENIRQNGLKPFFTATLPAILSINPIPSHDGQKYPGCRLSIRDIDLMI